MVTPIKCISAHRQNWRNSGGKWFKPMDKLISKCWVRQRTQRQPGVRIREKCHKLLLLLSSFHYLFIIILIPPTKFLPASSAWQKIHMALSHVRRFMDVSEPLGIQRQWLSASYSVSGARSLLPQCIGIPQCRHFVTCLNTSLGFTEPAAFSKPAETARLHKTICIQSCYYQSVISDNRRFLHCI